LICSKIFFLTAEFEQLNEVYWPAVASMAFMYVAVFVIGVYATRGKPQSDDVEELMLAGRSLPIWVGLLTMTATWVGGGYINGTTETAYSSGLLWGAQAGLGYALSLIVAGLLYAKVMRRRNYTTLVDPLEDRYGKYTAALLMIPAVLAELFWSAAILVALGATFGTVVGLDLTTAILSSAIVAIAYTAFGGLRAVAYTDVIQLQLILVGLCIAIPFAVSAAGGVEAVLGALSGTPDSPGAMTGFATVGEAISYADWTILLILGGIPWNVYFQRVLSTPSPEAASKLSIWAGVLCAVMVIPPLILGISGRIIDWSMLPALAGSTLDVAADLQETPAKVLPYILRYAVPPWVSVIGLGAVAAAVMSSVDSSILSAASLIAWNGYRRLFRPEATAQQITRIVRWLVVILGALATIIALNVSSVAALWYLCGDVVYCVLFPQLTLALFDPKANRIGALSGLGVSVFLRLGGGDATLGIPALIPYPLLEGGEFPFRTLAMSVGLLTALAMARLTQQADPPRPLRNH
jgi:high affinity choline transporter 7